MQPERRSLITTQGSSEQKLPSTCARVSFVVEASSPTSSAEASELLQRKRVAVRVLDTTDTRIERDQQTVRPVYTYHSGRAPTLEKYEATGRFTFFVRRLAKLHLFLDAALRAGATTVDEVEYDASPEELAAARSEALAAATKDAYRKATMIVRTLMPDCRSLLVSSVVEEVGSGSRRYQPMYEMASAPTASMAAPAPVTPGTISVESRITLVVYPEEQCTIRN